VWIVAFARTIASSLTTRLVFGFDIGFLSQEAIDKYSQESDVAALNKEYAIEQGGQCQCSGSCK
jgi:hypothetical protein